MNTSSKSFNVHRPDKTNKTCEEDINWLRPSVGGKQIQTTKYQIFIAKGAWGLSEQALDTILLTHQYHLFLLHFYSIHEDYKINICLGIEKFPDKTRGGEESLLSLFWSKRKKVVFLLFFPSPPPSLPRLFLLPEPPPLAACASSINRNSCNILT